MNEETTNSLVGRYTMPVNDAMKRALTVVGVERLKQKQEEALLLFLSGNDFCFAPHGLW